jgi:DNA-binding NarL/FixJ family response regulator
MTDPPELRVALVEDQIKYREALRLLLDGTPGFRCVAVFGSVEEALYVPVIEAPDVILLDIGLPGVSGSDAVGVVQERFPRAKVLMLTVFEDEATVFRALCNGAAGYILKKTPPAQLLEYIRDAASGGGPMSPGIARKVISMLTHVTLPTAMDCQLTVQETNLLTLLADGHSYKSAAARLKVSVNTIRNYVRSIYEKLHVHSKAEAVGKALRAGLI